MFLGAYMVYGTINNLLEALSHGCIRLYNRDVEKLYDLVI